MQPSAYRYHVFCCTNQRPAGSARGCCADQQAVELHRYFKEQVRVAGIPDVRINQSGCLDRCEEGPVVVIYPAGIWRRIESPADVDQLIREYLLIDQGAASDQDS